MEVCIFARSWRLWAVLLVLSCIAVAPSHAEKALSADEVVSNAVARAQRAEIKPSTSKYSYTKLTVTEEFDAEGNVKERKERVYEVTLQGGETSLKLVSVNGRPPSEADLKKQSENEVNGRHLVGPSKSGKGDKRESFLTPELTAHYNFKLEQQLAINGRPAYQIAFWPKNPEAPNHHIADRFLNRISGTIWIDVEEFEIAKAKVQLSSEVNLLGGVVGCLKKMAYTINRTRLADGIWLNTSSSGDFEGRRLVDSMRIKTRSNSSNFRLLGLAY